MQQAWARLAPLGKPIIPVGQAYDGFAEGGPPGVPNRGSIHRFMGAVADTAAPACRSGAGSTPPTRCGRPSPTPRCTSCPRPRRISIRGDQVRAYQTLLASLGFGVPATGTWGDMTYAAVRAFQAASHLPVTGVIDAQTREFLLRPAAPPLK